MLYPQTILQPQNEAQHRAVLDLSQKWPSLQAATVAPSLASEQPTLEQVRAKLTDLSRDGKNLEVKALLSRHGAKTLTQLAPEQYAAVLAEAGELC